MCREITVSEFLSQKERLLQPDSGDLPWVLEVDLSPFERGFPKLKDARNIGRGVVFLNRHLSGRLFVDGGTVGMSSFIDGYRLPLDGGTEAIAAYHRRHLDPEDPRGTWQGYLAAMRRHARAWQPILARCGRLPDLEAS